MPVTPTAGLAARGAAPHQHHPCGRAPAFADPLRLAVTEGGAPAFVSVFAGRIADTAKACLKDAKPITHIGTGEAKVERVASNRRYVDENGKVQYNRMSASRDPKIRAGEEGTIDPYLKTLSLWNGDRPLVALSVYSTHPMSYYGKGGESADFMGMARRRRQARC